jgi:hypothetical protein
MVTGHIVARDTFEADTTRMVEMAQEQAEDDEAVQAMGDSISAMLDEVGTSDDGTFVHVSVQEVMTGAEAINLGGSVFGSARARLRDTPSGRWRREKDRALGGSVRPSWRSSPVPRCSAVVAVATPRPTRRT